MTLHESADDLVTRCLPGYKDNRTGEIQFLLHTAHSKIAAQVACKMMGEKVAMTGQHNLSFDKDDFMANSIEWANLAKCCGIKAH